MLGLARFVRLNTLKTSHFNWILLCSPSKVLRQSPIEGIKTRSTQDISTGTTKLILARAEKALRSNHRSDLDQKPCQLHPDSAEAYNNRNSESLHHCDYRVNGYQTSSAKSPDHSHPPTRCRFAPLPFRYFLSGPKGRSHTWPTE